MSGSYKRFPADKKDEKTSLKKWNIAAGVVHMLIFLGSLGVAIWLTVEDRGFRALLTRDFIPSEGLASLGTYPLVWVEIWFPFITSIFHFVIAWGVLEEYAKWTLDRGINPLRWLEYAITASFMTWSIAQLSGITGIFTLLMVGVVGNVALQYQGYAMEMLNEKRKSQGINWTPTIVGWIIFAGQWAAIFTYFFINASSSSVPNWIYGVVIALFVQYSLFGLVQILHYTTSKGSFFESNWGVEVSFIVLSLVSKTSLDLMIVIGIATSTFEFTL